MSVSSNPTWWIRLAHLAPTLVGFSLAAVAYAHAGDGAVSVECVASGLAAALGASSARQSGHGRSTART